MSSFNPESYKSSSQCCSNYFTMSQISGSINKQDGFYAKAEIDATLAQTMTQLSFKEREVAQDDLHGVTEAIVEDRTHIDAGLKDLDLHLSSIKQGSVYEMAETMESSYVRDRAFRLSFLRSTRYNAKDAAKNMINFFSMKFSLFGREKLTKDISFSDLSEDDKDCLRTGCMQILPTTDRAGRQIVFQFPGLRRYKALDDEQRARFYIYTCLWKSEDSQTKGIVHVTYSIGHFQGVMNRASFVQSAKLGLAFPVYLASLHRCTNDIRYFILGKTELGVLPAHIRARTKYHLGSDQECQYVLSTYGIPSQTLPLDPRTNEPKLDGFLAWYNRQQWNEVQQDEPQSIPASYLHPRPNDVLVIPSLKLSNTGNELLRTLVKRRLGDYDLLSNKKKTEISDEIMNEIQRQGGRFLKQEDGTWKEMDLSEIRRKTKQTFRNIRYARSIEDMSKSSPISFHGIAEMGDMVDKVNPDDILFGTLAYKNHQGNVALRKVVRDLASEYDAATRTGKTRLTEVVLQQRKERGSRFLKRSTVDNDRWETLPDHVARSKISKLFRNIRR
eukprot:scaffold5752_cov120-Cylindrotheca_fusiformis.AAC.4